MRSFFLSGFIIKSAAELLYLQIMADTAYACVRKTAD